LDGLALYQYGYNPYTIFLSLSTLGIPIAISKFISKYNALGDYQTVQRLFRSGILVMSVTGILAFALLFYLAEPIARNFLNPEELEGNTIADAVFAIRMVSTALLIIPIMASIRGYF
ncbi:oligosaccharide flippase family protein, partial [Pseudomonas sp. 2822-17]|uniref:oligosaccharide flippase family protein n=1 Tax=Pseudomonas sp. 2822-17 TaxID=1712678 RepID=UPI0013040BA3